jgi:hypothetical protein
MTSGNAPLVFNVGLRANLRLWPLDEVSPAIRAIAQWDGRAFEQKELSRRIAEIQQGDGNADGATQLTKVAGTSRAARDALLVCRIASLAYVQEVDGVPLVRHTPLGQLVFSFLGLSPGGKCFANRGNLRLIAKPYIESLVAVRQYRAILQVMVGAGGQLTGDELNRAMAGLESGLYVQETARQILAYRAAGTVPTWQPSKAYPRPEGGVANAESAGDAPEGEPTEADAGDAQVAGDAAGERKAMNPHFLLAGGGGLFISVRGDSAQRTVADWALPLLVRALEFPLRSSYDAAPGRWTIAEAAAVALQRNRAAGLVVARGGRTA